MSNTVPTQRGPAERGPADLPVVVEEHGVVVVAGAVLPPGQWLHSDFTDDGRRRITIDSAQLLERVRVEAGEGR